MAFFFASNQVRTTKILSTENNQKGDFSVSKKEINLNFIGPTTDPNRSLFFPVSSTRSVNDQRRDFAIKPTFERSPGLRSSLYSSRAYQKQ